MFYRMLVFVVASVLVPVEASCEISAAAYLKVGRGHSEQTHVLTNTGPAFGFGFSGAFTPPKGVGIYLGLEMYHFTDGDDGRRGHPDKTITFPVGLSLSTKTTVFAPYMSLGWTDDDWDSWGLEGYLCDELGSKMGCEADSRFEFGAGIDMFLPNRLMIGASFMRNSGIIFNIGYASRRSEF